MTQNVTALTIKNAPAGFLKVETGLRFKSNGNGTGSWQVRHKVNGKLKTMSLGRYPDISLKEARELNAEYRHKVRNGSDPKDERDAAVRASQAAETTFKDITMLAYQDLKPTWKNGGARNGFMPKMEKYVFPEIGSRPASEITGKVLADLVRPLWHDRHPTANKILIHCSQVMGWAEAAEFDCDGFAVKRARKILGKTRYRTTNVASMDFSALPDFYAGLSDTMQDLGLKFYILTLPRTNNTARATWDQIKGNVWHLSADDMKREDDHFIPLTDPALEILDEAAKHYDKREGFIFKNSASWKTGHISTNNWTQQMRRHELDATAHGMRSTFKMWATLNKIDTDTIIEETLHHKVRGAVEEAYLRGHLAELRRPIMEKWARFVTGQDADIIEFSPAARKI